MQFLHREILLRRRPEALYDISSKGTVPVLMLQDGSVLDESIDIMRWVLKHRDYDKWLEDLAPHEPIEQYQHNNTGEDNADAHLKRQIMGREVVIAITKNELDFGPWEAIFYGEFDGQRSKRILVKIIGE